MQHFEFILDEAKQKATADSTKVRRMILWWLLFNITLATLFCATYLFNSNMSYPCIGGLVALIVFYFVLRRPMRKLLEYDEKRLRSLQNEPQTATDYIERAVTLSGYEYPEAALEDLHKGLEMEPDNPAHWNDIIEILWYNIHNGENALPYVERLAAIEGDDQAEALKIRGQILAKTDPETALASFDKAIELAPDDVTCRLARLRFFLDTDRLRDAAVIVSEMSKEMQKNSWTLEKAEFAELRGILAIKQQDLETAVKYFSKAIRFAPDESKYYTLRAEAYDALGEIGKAEADKRNAEKFK